MYISVTRTLLLISAGLLLAVAVGLVAYGENRPAERVFTGKVADLLPTVDELPGWSIERQPIATTPEMQKAVAEVLNFDDAVFAVMSTGVQRTSVYIAYWTPGKMSQRLIAGHTPDVCWVNAGWQLADRGQYTVDGLPVGERRTMEMAGKTEHVVFWHFVGGEAVSYSRGGLPPWHAVFTDLLADGISQRKEQLFVRVSSDSPTEQWKQMAAFSVLAENLDPFHAIEVAADKRATRN